MCGFWPITQGNQVQQECWPLNNWQLQFWKNSYLKILNIMYLLKLFHFIIFLKIKKILITIMKIITKTSIEEYLIIKFFKSLIWYLILIIGNNFILMDKFIKASLVECEVIFLLKLWNYWYLLFIGQLV